MHRRCKANDPGSSRITIFCCVNIIKCPTLFVLTILVTILIVLRGRSRDGAVARAPCGPRSIPGLVVICGLSLLLVLVLTLRGFSPGTPVFPSPQKPTFQSKFQLDLDNCEALYHEPLVRRVIAIK